MSSSPPPTPPPGTAAKKLKITVEQQQQQQQQQLHTGRDDTESTPAPKESKYEAKLLELQQELEAEKAKVQAIKAEIEAEKAKRRQLEAEREAKSLLSVCHSPPVLKIVASEERDFPMLGVRNLDDCLQLGLKETPSCLRALIESNGGILTYENVYDVQAIVQSALKDAACICNGIISKIVGDSNQLNLPNLAVRCDSTIFSNTMDYLVVFDVISGAPVFVVESKISLEDRMIPNMYGQVYDQLSEMHAKGHPNPFGALTCFNETYITWLDNDASQGVLKNIEEIQKGTLQRLENIIQNFVMACNDTSLIQMTTVFTDDSIQTQSPVVDVEIIAEDKNMKGNVYTCDKVHVLHSKCLTPPNIVEAFVSAIICSLDGFQKPHGIQKLTLKQDIVVGCLCMDSKSYSWGTLRTTYTGPKKLEGDAAPPESLYLVDHIGTGNTSRVYRALTEDGYDCVVKMYIKRKSDDKNMLSIHELFGENAKEAMTNECKVYQKIYGDELKGYVWTQVLNGIYCLICPYFEPLEKSQRAMQLSLTIPDRLSLFGITTVDNDGAFYAFHKGDQSWHHIGWFNGKLYMFDLGNLEQHELKKSHDLIQLHCETLRARMEEP
jgi:hypothetical protein